MLLNDGGKKLRSVVDGVLTERETSDGEPVKSGEGNAEFGCDGPPCKESGGIWGPNSMGDVAGRLSAGVKRGETSGLGGAGTLWCCQSSCFMASTGVRGGFINGFLALYCTWSTGECGSGNFEPVALAADSISAFFRVIPSPSCSCCALAASSSAAGCRVKVSELSLLSSDGSFA